MDPELCVRMAQLSNEGLGQLLAVMRSECAARATPVEVICSGYDRGDSEVFSPLGQHVVHELGLDSRADWSPREIHPLLVAAAKHFPALLHDGCYIKTAKVPLGKKLHFADHGMYTDYHLTDGLQWQYAPVTPEDRANVVRILREYSGIPEATCWGDHADWIRTGL